MIALQQPVTTDLRMIITVMKASSDLERMGTMRYPSRSQQFGSKAKRGSPKSKKKSQICRITSKMVDNVLVAYVKPIKMMLA